MAQGKLLRALQEGEVERVGGSRAVKVDVRVVAATNEDLREAVRAGRFREDLFFRLNVFPIHLPPLRDRRDDIPLLMSHFLQHYRHKHQGQAKGFTQAAVRALLGYDFPGNIRELQNLVERAVILAEDTDLIDTHHLFMGGEVQKQGFLTLDVRGAAGRLMAQGGASAALSSPSPTEPGPAPVASLTGGGRAIHLALDQAERELLKDALARSGGNYSAAARLLKISRAKLAYRARKHQL